MAWDCCKNPVLVGLPFTKKIFLDGLTQLRHPPLSKRVIESIGSDGIRRGQCLTARWWPTHLGHKRDGDDGGGHQPRGTPHDVAGGPRRGTTHQGAKRAPEKKNSIYPSTRGFKKTLKIRVCNVSPKARQNKAAKKAPKRTANAAPCMFPPSCHRWKSAGLARTSALLLS